MCNISSVPEKSSRKVQKLPIISSIMSRVAESVVKSLLIPEKMNHLLIKGSVRSYAVLARTTSLSGNRVLRFGTEEAGKMKLTTPSIAALASTVPRRFVSTPVNTVVKFVPHQEAWVIERMGKFHRILDPGLNVLVPLLDRIRYVQTLKEIAIEVPKQTAITNDSVPLSLDGVLFVRIVDPYKASYGVEDPEFAITQLAQTTMRSELGKISLDHVFRERESLNANIVAAINNASAAWGISCMRYEIRDIHLPANVQEAMQMQVAAERKKRAAILESEGVRESDINIAEGKKRAQILASEALKAQTVNIAQGEAAAIVAKAEARAIGLKNVAEALQAVQGSDAASLMLAEQYVTAFSNLAKETNTVIIPNATNDIAGSVTQAMAIYKNVSSSFGSNRDDISKPLATAAVSPAQRKLKSDSK